MKIENEIGYKFTATQRDDRGNLNLSAESPWSYFREQVNFFRCILLKIFHVTVSFMVCDCANCKNVLGE